MTRIISRMSFNFGQIGPSATELSALERLKIPPYTYNEENGLFDRPKINIVFSKRS